MLQITSYITKGLGTLKRCFQVEGEVSSSRSFKPSFSSVMLYIRDPFKSNIYFPCIIKKVLVSVIKICHVKYYPFLELPQVPKFLLDRHKMQPLTYGSLVLLLLYPSKSGKYKILVYSKCYSVCLVLLRQSSLLHNFHTKFCSRILVLQNTDRNLLL